MSLGKFVISRYGVIELDLVRAEMPFESKRIKKWGFKHKGRDYTGEKVNGVAVESIALDCHGVSLTLVDPPMLEWKDRLSKVWIKVAPLG